MPDPDQKTDWQSPALLVAATAATLAVGVYYSDLVINPPAPPVVFGAPINRRLNDAPSKFRLEWGDALTAEQSRLGWVTDIYTTTNFQVFTSLGYTQSNRVNIPTTNALGFFVTRHRNTNSGAVTAWNVKK